MEAMMELCDLIAQKPGEFKEKLAWICGRCPQPDMFLVGLPRVSRSQLNAVLAVARFLSKSQPNANKDDHDRPTTLVLAFYLSIRSSFHHSFWPQSFSQDAVASFYNNYMTYVCLAASSSADFATDVAGFTGETVSSAVNVNVNDQPGGQVRAFLQALAQNFPPIITSDANKLVSTLIEHLGIPASKAAGDNAGAWKSNADLVSENAALTDGGAQAYLRAFDEESVESLEKKVVVLKLLGCILDKVPIDAKILEQVRAIAIEQFQSMIVFLKTRKSDWSQQGQSLKAKINAKLSVYQATTILQMKVLASFDLDGKYSKSLLHGSLALSVESAEACLVSVWRKLRACEELFSSLLSGISQAAVARNGQLLCILLIRFKPLVLVTCAQVDTSGSSQGTLFESLLKTCCGVIEFGWSKDRSPIDTFIMGLASSIRERNDYGEESQDVRVKQAAPPMQLNIIRLLADLTVSLNKSEVVDMILPLFIECLEEGDASNPCLLRLHLLDAVSRMGALGFEKSYREAVVLMTRSYLCKLCSAGSDETTPMPEATTERVETLPAGFLLIASGLTSSTVRSDYRQRLLSLCSDVGLAAASKSGRSGAEFLGPLLPAVAEMCSDFDPSVEVDPSLLKLFRNLWFYIALFGLVPPVQRAQCITKADTVGSMRTNGIQAVNGPYMFSAQLSSAFQGISHGTPPLVVSSVKWLEDELELNALQNPGSQQATDNKKVAVSQRTALSAALGGRVEVSAMSSISGVKATYLLAVAFLEIIRFSRNGGVLNGGSGSTASRSAFSCVFEYLKSPNLMTAVTQCLTAIVHQAFETSMGWLEDRLSETGVEADNREFALSVHACFLIRNLSQRDEHVRNTSVNLLAQLRDRFPQVLWNSASLDFLLSSVHNDPPSAVVSDPAWVGTNRALYQKIVREWITISLSYAPCTTQGLLQEKLCKANTWKGAQPSTDVVSLLSEIRIGTGKNDCWSGTKPANIPAVMAAAAAASGGNVKSTEAFNLEVLGTGVVSTIVKCYHAGEIAGMKRLYESLGGPDAKAISHGSDLGLDLPASEIGVSSQTSQSFIDILITKFVRQLQKFVNASENGGEANKSSFRESCSQATALILSNLGSDSEANVASFSQLLHLLCWCPAYILTPDAMETGVFIWTWLVSAAPQLGSMVLSELVDAWLWTVDTRKGLFASEARYSGPAAKLRPHLEPGESEALPDQNPVEHIMAHRLWLGFFIDRFEVVRHDSVEQLLLIFRLVQRSTNFHHNFSQHPAATGTFFTLMLLGLNFCACRSHGNLQNFRTGLQLLEDRVYRASLGWFSHEPQWNNMDNSSFAQSEAQCVSVFIQHLQIDRGDVAKIDSKGKITDNMKDQYHPIWGQMENYDVGKEKRKQLLLMLCQHEVDRLEVWAQPVNTKDSGSRPKISSEKWVEYARTAFSVDPRIAFCLAATFPTNAILKSEVTQLVQTHILEICNIPQALPYFVTPKSIEENSALLQQLQHWAACSVTQALEFVTPAFKGHPLVMAYVLRVLESYPPERVTFFMPQLVQSLRYDKEKLVEGYLLRAAQRSDIFAHILLWHLQGETCVPQSGEEAASAKNIAFQELLPAVRERIIDGFSPMARDIFEREFDFFDKVTSISGVLFPLPKEERRAGIRRELEKIQVEGEDLYLPTAPSKLVRGIQVDSGIPLQSAAKVPIMITFNVADREGDLNEIKPQACIFKVGDDCRQDVLALQVISLLKDIYEAIGVDLYLYPYGVLPTGPERGIIEVVPNSRSRSQMGETNDGGLYEIFQQDFGAVGSPGFEAARENFIVSSAGYAVASLLLQPKDRHNGNLLFDNVGRLVHIDFGFLLETSPGKNMRFESAHFKLSHEMTQLLDPSGVMKSESWYKFVGLCVKGYLAARRHMDGIIITVLLMLDSGLPCFSRGDPIGNLRKRFHPEMNEREAANFMIKICSDAYDKWTTAGYDLIQYCQHGIDK